MFMSRERISYLALLHLPGSTLPKSGPLGCYHIFSGTFSRGDRSQRQPRCCCRVGGGGGGGSPQRFRLDDDDSCRRRILVAPLGRILLVVLLLPPSYIFPCAFTLSLWVK